MNYKDVTVVIPTLNEEKNISVIINLIKKLYKKIDILVVDDGSRDNTQKIVKKIKNVRLLDRSKEKVKGLTASVVDGTKLVKTDYIVIIDADLQHPAQKIGEIVKKLRKGCDIVIATRKKIGKWSLSRRIISKIATVLGKVRLLLKGMYVSDPVSGFFGIKTKIIKNVLAKNEGKFEKQGYKVLFDILKYCNKVRIGTVFYEFKERSYGGSKIGKKQIIAYLKSLFK